MAARKDSGLSAIREAKKLISLDLDDILMRKVREIALRDGISPNDVVRQMIGLSSKQAKRPRLSLSLTSIELSEVENRMKVKPGDTSKLKQIIIESISKEKECE